jgi:hypothetical protein
LILKDAILENLFWLEPNNVRGTMGAHSSENCHFPNDKNLGCEALGYHPPENYHFQKMMETKKP